MELQNKPFYLNEKQIAWVENTLNKMTTNQKAGQLFCILGDLYDEKKLNDLVLKYQIGGILLRPDAREVVRDRFRALDALSDIPLLHAANMEDGGTGAVCDGTQLGCNMQIAAAGDPVWAKRLAEICVEEGRSAGINWTFSPVTDIDMNFRNPITNTRTFGSNPETVKTMSLAYMETVQNGKIAACAKHFPGDGVDYRDHHLHPTVNSLPADEWYASYGAVYKTLIDAGLLSIMTGHILQPNVAKEINPSLADKDILPSSLSKELLTGVLREKFGFNGLITTDATIMGGYTQAMERKMAIPGTIAAGCDMILFNTDFEQDFGFLISGIEDGLVSMARLDEAVTRVLALKAHLASVQELPQQLSDYSLWQKECADQSVTLVKNTQAILPVTPEKTPDVRVIMLGKDECPQGRISEIICKELNENGFKPYVYVPEQDNMHGVPQTAGQLDLYIANYECFSDQTTIRISWNRKFALDLPRFIHETPSIFISFANPYHLQDVPYIKTYINAYCANETTIRSTVEKLVGRQEFCGISPVDAFCGLPDTRL